MGNEEIGSQPTERDTLTYEETPPIEPVVNREPDIFPPPKPQNPILSILTTIIFFVLLFIIGFWLSGFVRKYAGTLFTRSGQTKTVSEPTPTPESVGSTMTSITPSQMPANVWKTYQVLSGTTRIAYDGISFKLPSGVLPLICDGSACKSQGTYLPGGTRFTVALRGEGQILPDFRGKIVSDLKGIPFPIKEMTLKGWTVSEFNGTFIGTTVGGYVFSRMRGYMIPVSDTVSFEINHFSPKGTVSDFVKDDSLFDEIVQTLTLPAMVSEKGGTGSPSAVPNIGE